MLQLLSNVLFTLFHFLVIPVTLLIRFQISLPLHQQTKDLPSGWSRSSCFCICIKFYIYGFSSQKCLKSIQKFWIMVIQVTHRSFVPIPLELPDREIAKSNIFYPERIETTIYFQALFIGNQWLVNLIQPICKGMITEMADNGGQYIIFRVTEVTATGISIRPSVRPPIIVIHP